MDELQILNAARMPSTLETLDARVLSALAGHKKEATATRRAIALAAFVSLGGGFVAGSAIIPPAVAASPFAPLMPASPLAPSTLLDAR